jgi:predicted small lipoprotein YifL
MKKLSLMLLFTLVTITACGEKKETPTPVTPEATPVETPAEPEPVAEEKKGTTIKIGSDGVEYSDKNTEIEISTDKKN